MEIEEYITKLIHGMDPLMQALETRIGTFKISLNTATNPDIFGMMNKMMEILLGAFTDVFGPAAKEMMEFGNTHKKELDGYLADHPDFKEKIDIMKAKLKI